MTPSLRVERLTHGGQVAVEQTRETLLFLTATWFFRALSGNNGWITVCKFKVYKVLT